MKTIIRIGLFSFLILLTVFLSYRQWFSTASPVLYFPPIETSIPDQLQKLIVLDDEKEKSISTQSSTYTVLIFDYPDPDLRNEIARSINAFQEKYENMGLAIYYLWQIESESFPQEYVSTFLDSSSSFTVSNRLLKNYQDNHELYISQTPFIVVYNQEGEKVTQFDFPIHRETIAKKLLNIPRYDLLNNP